MQGPSARFQSKPGTLTRADAKEKRVAKHVNPFH